MNTDTHRCVQEARVFYPRSSVFICGYGSVVFMTSRSTIVA